MKRWPDRTAVKIGDYQIEDHVRASAIVKRLKPTAVRFHDELSVADIRHLKGMLLYGRQISRAYRRIEFGEAIISRDQVDEMVQDALIQLGDLHQGTSLWNLAVDFCGWLTWSRPRFRPRPRRIRNPLKATAEEMEFIERARGLALVESVLTLEACVTASLSLLFRAWTAASCAGKERVVLWPRLVLL